MQPSPRPLPHKTTPGLTGLETVRKAKPPTPEIHFVHTRVVFPSSVATVSYYTRPAARQSLIRLTFRPSGADVLLSCEWYQLRVAPSRVDHWAHPGSDLRKPYEK